MGWPKGVSRRKLAEPPKVVVEGQPDLVLTIRRIRVGSFAGLWELGRVLPDGSIQIVTDANTKLVVMNLARNEITKCGQ